MKPTLFGFPDSRQYSVLLEESAVWAYLPIPRMRRYETSNRREAKLVYVLGSAICVHSIDTYENLHSAAYPLLLKNMELTAGGLL
jgi:hypothetical protein